jgi:hypothetical protein
MFYPTLETQVGGSAYQINEPYFRFIILVDTMGDLVARDRLAKDAFRHVLATRDACKSNKALILEDILAKCPHTLNGITDDEMLDSLRRLRDQMLNRGESISTSELKWVAKYMRNDRRRQEAEKIIYYVMLLGSSHWDESRRRYPWTISKQDQVALIGKAINSDSLGNKRRMELAKEIGVPTGELSRPYFRKLLWDQHYDKAAEVGMVNEEDVFAVVSDNLNAGYFRSALEIIQRFLPKRQDLIDEVERIIAAFSS